MDMGDGVSENEYRNIADIYVDSQDNICVNWIEGITVEQMRNYLKRALDSFDDMTVKVAIGEIDKNGKNVSLRGTGSS